MKRLFLCIFSFFLLHGSCFGLEIIFHDKAMVTKSYISLGDVASFDQQTPLTESLASQIISKSPQPGETLFIKATEIKRQIQRKANVPRSIKWTGSNIVKILRDGQQIAPEQLNKAISDYLKEKNHALPKAEISFKPKSLPLPFMVPKGELDIEVVPSHPSIVRSSRFTIILRVDGKVRKNVSIQGDLEVLAPVVVASEPLRRGEILTPANISLSVKNLAEFKNPCTNPRVLLGKRLKRSVRDGSIVSSTDVESPPLVKKGQLVKVLFSKGNLHITATGIARMDGMQDQIIRVKNASSNKIIHGRVAAPGIVEVKI